MSLKSLHITNYYHKDSGGISTAYNKLLEAANRRERYVRLIVPGEESCVEEVGEFGRIYYVKANFSPFFDKRYRLMLPWNTYIFDNSPIKAILREEKPEIIEIGEKYTLSLMAGLLRKHIMNVGTRRPMLVQFSCERMDDNVSSFISAGRISKWFTRRYTANYNLPMFDFHLANSAYTGQEFFDSTCALQNPHRSDRMFNLCWRYLRAAQVKLKDRVFINQCGVDNKTFNDGRKNDTKRRELAAEFGFPADSRLLLYAGRISPEKNPDLLIKTIARLSRINEHNYRLLVAGSGPGTKYFADQSEILAPGRVHMLGQIADKDKLADLFANCDAFVHPNPHEPFGITPLEAMASGLPVVAPNSGGLLSYANSTNAWLSEPRSASFAAEVESVFADKAVRRSKINFGIATADRYDWDTSTDALFALYDRMYSEFIASPELFDYTSSPETTDFAGTLTKC